MQVAVFVSESPDELQNRINEKILEFGHNYKIDEIKYVAPVFNPLRNVMVYSAMILYYKTGHMHNF